MAANPITFPSYDASAWSGLPTAPTFDTSNLDFSSLLKFGQPNPSASTPARSPVPTVLQPKLGWNLNTAQTGLNFAQTGANIWSAWKAASLAQQQLDYAKQIGNANLANQIKSYNTNLEGKADMNAVVGGWTPEKTQQYIDNNKLTGK